MLPSTCGPAGDGDSLRGQMNEFKLIVEPDADEAEAAQVFVDGTIGARKYRFLLDTGAARSSVMADDYTSTFTCTEQSDSSGVFAASSDDLITVPHIQVGPISKRNFTLVRTTDKDLRPGNLIGMDFLKDLCCHFFFDDNRVLVDGNQDCGTGYAFQELLIDKRFHPYVDVQFGTLRAKAVWDTGASITVVDMNLINRHPAFFQPAGQSTGTDSTGTRMETPMYSMSTTIVGSTAFPPHKVAGVDLSRVNSTIEAPMDLILGYNTLRRANWLFDFPGKKWAISNPLGIR
jgi:hypothetical protein